jgi:hypothetical protein
LHHTYNDWNRGEFVCAGEFGDIEKSVYGEKEDMIFAGDETSGLSNAIVGARLICVNPERASGAVPHVDYED